jgi:hypothetical protein
MMLISKPDGLIDAKDRGLWMMPPFDLAFALIGVRARPRIRRVPPVDDYAEVWRLPNSIQRVSYGFSGAKRELAICSAEEGMTIPPYPDDAASHVLMINTDGELYWY